MSSYYETELATMRQAANALALDTRRLTWSLHRTVLDAIRRTVSARVEALKEANEVLRRSPREQERIAGEIEREEALSRGLAAGAARYKVEKAIGPLAERYRTLVERMRRDVSLSFPNALDGFRPVDMIHVEQLRETLRPLVEAMGIDDLTERYNTGIGTRSARGLVECELIVGRVRRGGVSQQEADVAKVKALSEMIDADELMRVPSELGAIDDAIHLASKAISRANAAQVRPINIERDATAKRAYENEADAYEADLKAGAAR